MRIAKAVSSLPEGYKAIYSVNLKNDKKAALTVNLLAIAIGVLLVVPMLRLVPFSNLIDFNKGILNYILRFAAIPVLQIAYLVLHELVHGLAMKICGTSKIKYGFTGMYAFAGSNDYYGKAPYIFIALAPIILWGVVLAVAAALVSPQWFWVVYLVQVTNLSGAAGDIFVTVRFSRFPSDILVKDSGVSMTVYSKNTP